MDIKTTSLAGKSTVKEKKNQPLLFNKKKTEFQHKLLSLVVSLSQDICLFGFSPDQKMQTN